MSRAAVRALGLSGLVALLPLTSALAQAHPDAQAGVEYRTVSFGSGLGIKQLRELAIPLGVTLPINSRNASFRPFTRW